YRLQEHAAVVDAVRRIRGVRVVRVPRGLHDVIARGQTGRLPDGGVGAGARGMIAQRVAVARGPVQPAAAGLAIARLRVVHDHRTRHDDGLACLGDVVALVGFEDGAAAVDLGEEVERAAV